MDEWLDDDENLVKWEDTTLTASDRRILPFVFASFYLCVQRSNECIHRPRRRQPTPFRHIVSATPEPLEAYMLPGAPCLSTMSSSYSQSNTPSFTSCLQCWVFSAGNLWFSGVEREPTFAFSKY
eukprot:4226481-Prymnesium_polylepis.1